MGLTHQYYLFATGIKMRPATFSTRRDAESRMHEICQHKDIVVECTECDKHERKYSNHKGVRFYINRI